MSVKKNILMSKLRKRRAVREREMYFFRSHTVNVV